MKAGIAALWIAALALFSPAGCSPSARLAGPGAPGALLFAVTPPEAEVVLDGVPRGKASDFAGERTLAVPGGSHRVELRMEGRESYSRDVFVDGGVIRVRAFLAPVAPPGSGY